MRGVFPQGLPALVWALAFAKPPFPAADSPGKHTLRCLFPAVPDMSRFRDDMGLERWRLTAKEKRYVRDDG